MEVRRVFWELGTQNKTVFIGLSLLSFVNFIVLCCSHVRNYQRNVGKHTRQKIGSVKGDFLNDSYNKLLKKTAEQENLIKVMKRKMKSLN